jgi:hypothetical protein
VKADLETSEANKGQTDRVTWRYWADIRLDRGLDLFRRRTCARFDDNMALHTPSLRLMIGLLLVLLFSLVSTAAPTASSPDGMMRLEERADTSRLVFAHFLVGIVSDRTSAADYDADMIRAKEMGIDAFALNIGTNDFTSQQLDYAYESAANNGMKVFISFDFNWWDETLDAAAVGRNISQYASRPAQLMIGGKVFASSFLGNGLDVGLMRNASGVDVYWAPNYWAFATDVAKVDAALNWAVRRAFPLHLPGCHGIGN